MRILVVEMLIHFLKEIMPKSAFLEQTIIPKIHSEIGNVFGLEYTFVIFERCSNQFE